MILGIPSLMVARGRKGLDTMYWDSVVQVAGADFTTTSTSLVDITGLTLPVVANSLYEIEVVLRCQDSAANGYKIGMNYSAAGATMSMYYLGLSSGSVTQGGLVTLNSAGATLGATSAVNQLVYVKAIFIIGVNAGNITMKIQSATAGTETVYIGSIMKIRKLA